jgi:hypothetical protein
MPDAPVTALRGTIVSFTGDPFLVDPAGTYVAGALANASDPVDA